MSRNPPRNHSSAFKARAAITVRKGEKTLAELSQAFDVRPNQIQKWRGQLLSGASGVFDAKAIQPEPVIDLKSLHAKMGELTLERDFVRRAREDRSPSERKAMICAEASLNLSRQAALLDVSRAAST